ncbi:hypothetical protein BJX68DRAFT_238762 [Aspergillus pseudodeflectus]|uniref:Uncharacterized protein n=1 Tax=Aspergillus pseudodeflectus TaxID=176178 RepID=A0ABR4K7H5_9EURO
MRTANQTGKDDVILPPNCVQRSRVCEAIENAICNLGDTEDCRAFGACFKQQDLQEVSQGDRDHAHVKGRRRRQRSCLLGAYSQSRCRHRHLMAQSNPLRLVPHHCPHMVSLWRPCSKWKSSYSHVQRRRASDWGHGRFIAQYLGVSGCALLQGSSRSPCRSSS